MIRFRNQLATSPRLGEIGNLVMVPS